MKYVSIDLETTGLNANSCKILSVGMVVEDTNNLLPFRELPRLELRVSHKTLNGSLFALNLNKYLIEDILNETPRENIKYTTVDSLEHDMYNFFWKSGLVKNTSERVNVAGKNFNGFDRKFLDKVLKYEYFRFGRRVIDPSTQAADWKKDETLPSLEQIKDRLRILGPVTHAALEDAEDVVLAMRKLTNNYA